MIYFRCPTCKHNLRSQDELAGTKLACDKCRQRLLIPPRRNKTVLGEIISPETEDKQEELPAVKTELKKIIMSKLTKFRIRIGILLCVLAIVLGFFLFPRDKRDRMPSYAPATPSLNGTQWTGNSTWGGYVSSKKLTFMSNGQVMNETDREDQMGTWTQDGTKVKMNFGIFTCDAKISGSSMTGTAKDNRGQWKFDVARR